jgi:hypothetical protein
MTGYVTALDQLMALCPWFIFQVHAVMQLLLKEIHFVTKNYGSEESQQTHAIKAYPTSLKLFFCSLLKATVSR